MKKLETYATIGGPQGIIGLDNLQHYADFNKLCANLAKKDHLFLGQSTGYLMFFNLRTNVVEKFAYGDYPDPEEVTEYLLSIGKLKEDETNLCPVRDLEYIGLSEYCAMLSAVERVNIIFNDRSLPKEPWYRRTGNFLLEHAEHMKSAFGIEVGVVTETQLKQCEEEESNG